MDAPQSNRSRRPHRLARGIALLVYLVLMASVVGGLQAARQWAFRTYGDPAAQTQWEKFRSDVAESAGKSPVARKVPRSLEPPALVLLRDHFLTCNVISLVLTSALYGAVTFLALGIVEQTESPAAS